MNDKNSCEECMYYKDSEYCIRKIKMANIKRECMHYVKNVDRYSLYKLLELMTNVIE